ncbi:nuclear transport factor 2 family protein [Caulobacter soli]|uniref:nuclear transport factor 2 family protein n=1 Tax=Caulobacter soli TaxID=2708539 RepID=UPI0013EA375A|nr:nuclear transport factor 2 family protein [Caulobacter soli]
MTAPGFADWLAIANLKARYCRFLDTKDWAAYADLFTPDVVIDTTPSGGPRMEGREAALASIRASLDAAKTVHHVHSPEIEIDGDAARAVWAMQDQLSWSNGRKLSGAGHYHERYVRQDGDWKIAESRLTRLWLEMQPSG